MDAVTLTAWSTGILALATLGVAAATLIYAFATRKIAGNAHLATRAQVVSSTRLAWMDSVRDAVAELLSLDAAIKRDEAKELGAEFVENLVQRRLMIRYRIEFRLDPEKPLHEQLLKKIDDAIASESTSEAKVKSVSELTVTIMESEWRRVRREVGANVSADALNKTVLLMPEDQSK